MNANLSTIRRLVPTSVTNAVGRFALKAGKNSPHILFGVGMVGFGATIIASSRATLQVEDVLTNAQKDLANINEVVHNRDIANKHGYSSDDALQDRVTVYARTTVQLGKLYLPAVGFGVVTIVCLTKSHMILANRNAALVSAYVGLESAFNSYRDRVREKIGDEEERDIYYAAEKVHVHDVKTGKQVDTGLKKVGIGSGSNYARFFDELCEGWQKVPEYNYIFLRARQQYANDMLVSRGHLFLNEVYDMLGIPHSRAGQIVGWIISEDGDNYVDFGFMDGNNPKARDFVNGREGSILLDFNVDGVIYDKI
jgi:hypothetical protein